MNDEQLKKNLGVNIVAHRKRHGLTQAGLAEKLNYTDKAVSKWEVGSVLPDIETLAHIAEFFGITVNDLIYPKKETLTVACPKESNVSSYCKKYHIKER